MKKSKTRAFSLLLSLLLSLCLLCGCGNQAVEVEANTAQTQEEILTPVQTKREKKTKKTESATKEETKKEETKAVEERKNSSADLITDEKLTEDKKEQESLSGPALSKSKVIHICYTVLKATKYKNADTDEKYGRVFGFSPAIYAHIHENSAEKR